MEIIYQDISILVINKPAGVLCIPDGYDRTIPHIRSILEPDFGRLWVVHRLDKETSGIVLLARSEVAHQHLNDQFAKREIKKQYASLIYGICPLTFSIDLPLEVNGDRRHRTVINQQSGKYAKTNIETIDYFEKANCCLINAFPETGYTHQIRAHLLFSGFPILGDLLYYSKESKSFSSIIPIKRVALHAQKITFHHPDSGESISFSSELPDDFIQTISYLEK
jgi:RluA family pseudouridine synthase